MSHCGLICSSLVANDVEHIFIISNSHVIFEISNEIFCPVFDCVNLLKEKVSYSSSKIDFVQELQRNSN